MAYQQYQEDDFDPYLLREDDASNSPSYGPAQETYIPSPVSPWQTSASPAATDNQFVDETPLDAQTPTAQHLKIEPTAVVYSCPPAPSAKPTAKPLSAGSWREEILSAFFSIACTAAMIIVLIKFDGKVLSSWAWYISPNAVISILSTGSKAAMILPVAECISQLKWIYLDRHEQNPSLEHLQVYDNASRGPLGSFNFFWRARGVSWRVSLVSYLGCIITIAALALDPFAQQILVYNDNNVPAPNVRSSVPRAQAYDYGGTGSTGAGTYMNSIVNSAVIGAALSGIYGVQTEPPFSCPGANCTFPDFQTMGICPGVCTDVTAQTIRNCNDDCANRTSSKELTNCTYTTPSGFSLYAYSFFNAHQGWGYSTINTSVSMVADNVTAASLFAMGLVTFNNSLELAQAETGACDSSWQDTLKAYDCFMDLCAISYENYSYVDGSLQEGTIRTSQLNKTDMVGYSLVYETLDKDFPGNQSYYFNANDAEDILSELQIFFNTKFESEDVTSVFQTALYNSGNVSRSLDYAGQAMTYRFMQGPNTTMVYGNVTQTETYIHVQWPWLSLTFVLVILSSILLFATIIITHKAHQLVWKSSLAPLMYADSRLSPVGGKLGRAWTMEERGTRIDTIRSGLSKQWR